MTVDREGDVRLLRLLQRAPIETFPSDPVRWRVGAAIAPDAYEDDPVDTLEQLVALEEGGAGVTLPTEPAPDAAPVAEDRQWLVSLCQTGKIAGDREFHSLALAYAAARQVRHCPVYPGHERPQFVEGALRFVRRPAEECLGFLNEATFDVTNGRLLARLNVTSSGLQSRLELAERYSLMKTVQFSLATGGAYSRPPRQAPSAAQSRRRSLEITLIYRLQSVDVVPSAGCPKAHALGRWTDASTHRPLLERSV